MCVCVVLCSFFPDIKSQGNQPTNQPTNQPLPRKLIAALAQGDHATPMVQPPMPQGRQQHGLAPIGPIAPPMPMQQPMAPQMLGIEKKAKPKIETKIWQVQRGVGNQMDIF